VFQTELEILLSHQVDMHTASPKIKEDMKIPKVLTIKQYSRKNLESDKTGILGSLPQMHQDSNLDKDSFQVTYKHFTLIWGICTI
jgi:hypothetical protein